MANKQLDSLESTAPLSCRGWRARAPHHNRRAELMEAKIRCTSGDTCTWVVDECAGAWRWPLRRLLLLLTRLLDARLLLCCAAGCWVQRSCIGVKGSLVELLRRPARVLLHRLSRLQGGVIVEIAGAGLKCEGPPRK